MNESERSHARLTQSLRMLSEIEAGRETPSRVETAVMARWDAAHRSRERARSRARRVVRAATTAAAGIMLIGGMAWQLGPDESDIGQEAVRLPPSRDALRWPREPDTTESGVLTRRLLSSADRSGRRANSRRANARRARCSENWGCLHLRRTVQRGATRWTSMCWGEDGVARGVRVPINEL